MAARGWIPLCMFFALAANAHAQEVARPSQARQKGQTALPTGGNFRVGEVVLRVDARMSVEYTDNVDTSQIAKPDVILTPSVGISAIWVVSRLNTLRLSTSIGYASHLNYPNLDRQTLTISPDSALSLDMFIGDVKFNLHNQFSIAQEAYNQGSLSGVAQIERFTNTLGFSILWDTNDIVWNLNYDHYTFLTLGGANSSSGTVASNISAYDHSTDQVSASAVFRLNSSLLGGIESVFFMADYPEHSASNYSGIGAGIFFESQLTKFSHLNVAGGLKSYTAGETAPGSVALSSATSAQPASGNPSGVYFNASINHRLNRFYSDQIALGHTDDIDALNGHTKTNYVRYSGNWLVNTKTTLGIGAFWEDATVIAGSALGGTVPSDYRRYGFSLSTSLQISEHLDLGLSYQFLKKQAERATENYVQNRFTITLGYRF